MNILKLTDKPTELEAVKDKVVEELQYLRSLDTAGDGGDFGRPWRAVARARVLLREMEGSKCKC